MFKGEFEFSNPYSNQVKFGEPTPKPDISELDLGWASRSKLVNAVSFFEVPGARTIPPIRCHNPLTRVFDQ